MGAGLLDLGLSALTADRDGPSTLPWLLGGLAAAAATVGAISLENVPKCAAQMVCRRPDGSLTTDFVPNAGYEFLPSDLVDPTTGAVLEATRDSCLTIRADRVQGRPGYLVNVTAYNMPELRGKRKAEIAAAMLEAFGLPLEYAGSAEVRKSPNTAYHPNTYFCELTVQEPLDLSAWQGPVRARYTEGGRALTAGEAHRSGVAAAHLRELHPAGPPGRRR